MKSLLRLCLACTLAVAPISALVAQSRWIPYGPDGGDARAFASDPHDHNHVFLGTVSGTIYDTHDGGQTWTRLARVGKRDDLVLDNIVVDPADANHILVGGWVLDRADGGLYSSNDGGKTWAANQEMNGHSIRALSVAPSDPKIMVLGALDGVFRSVDSGKTWSLITPSGSHELHEIESIAIDPKNPRTIYAGTWHLPWKTTDGGEHWTNMKQGIIDDSDVFSIIVDPTNAKNVYLSACSGIYRSTDEGAQFEKVKGIPSTARRTRVLMEDSKQPGIVFAGTTEGLWRTTDAGHNFQRNGDPGWIINDVNIDPQNSQHVLLATDRTGILLSNDGGLTFTPANRGFSARQISAVVQDKSDNARLSVGVLNDKAAGGVFTSADGGQSWQQSSTGLGGADVFSLGQTPGGILLAGTRHGIYRLENGSWKSSGLTLELPPDPSEETAKPVSMKGRRSAAARQRATSNPVAKGTTPERRSSAAPIKAGTKRSASASTAPTRSTPPRESTTGVYALANNDTGIFAATEEGLVTSTDDGHTWNRVRTANGTPWRVVAAQGSRVAVADLKAAALSSDKGATFHAITAPAELSMISSMTIDDTGRLWVGGREGVYLSEDDGSTWHAQKGLFVPNVSGIFYDQTGSRILVTSYKPGTTVFAVHVPDMAVRYWEAGWELRQVRPVGDHLVGVTPYDGIVLEPKINAPQQASTK